MGLIDKIIDKTVDIAMSKSGLIIAGALGAIGAIVAAGMKGGPETETCPYCGGTLTFHESELIYLEYLECKSCGRQLTDEELSAEKDEEEEEEEYISTVNDILEIPVGCRACGGDYPNCINSCNMFED